MTLPAALKRFDWQAGYEGSRSGARAEMRARAVAIADRVPEHAAQLEFAVLIGATRTGGFDAAHHGAPELLGNPFFDLGIWLERTAREYRMHRTHTALDVGFDAVVIPSLEVRFEVESVLRGLLPASLIVLAGLLAPRQPSRRMVIVTGSLTGTTAAAAYRRDADCSRIVVDLAAHESVGCALDLSVAHEVAHAADPNLGSDEERDERFAERLAPILLERAPMTLAALDELIVDTEEAIGHSRAQPGGRWGVLDDLLEFEHAPLQRVPNAAAAPVPLAGPGGPDALPLSARDRAAAADPRLT